MGFVGFLRFSLLCLDFLAWPTFALIYPLWSSIRAIETSSKYHMKKLVIYWTIFSLISLFEIFFVRLIRCVPFWPYIKLVSVFWLVMPQFDGACIAYQHLVHPCLSFSMQDIINRFSIPKEIPYNEDSFLASAETYLKENGPEALEKLIANKAKSIEPILGDADAMEVVKRVEPAEKNVTSEEQLVEQPKLELVEIENKEIAASEEAQRVTTPAEIREKIPIEIQTMEKVQREWTCAVCQLTTTSEADLNSHLKGRRHRSKCEKLKTSAAPEEAQRVTTPAERKEKIPIEIPKKVQREWTCSVCQLTTTSEATLNSHLQGRRHRSKCEQLKTSAQTDK